MIQLSGATPGNISCLYIPKGKKLKVTSDNYVASTPNLKISGKAAFGGILTGYGLFYTTIEANESGGLVWLSSFGDMLEIKILPGDTIQFDNGILLALDDDIQFKTTTLGGLKSFFFSGEGIVTIVENTTNKPITIYVQSRSKSSFSDYIKSIADTQIQTNKAVSTVANWFS